MSRCTVDVVHHPRVGRCVLRYELRPGAAGLAELRHRSLFGKVYADAGHPAVAASVLRLLHRGLPALPGGERVRVPRPLGVVQPLRLGLAEDIGGQAVLPQLLRTALDRRDPAAPHGSTSLYEAVVSAALVAAALHHCPVPAEAHLPVRDLATEWARYRAKLAVVAVVWPEVADDVDRRLTGALTAADAATVTAGDSGASGPRVLAHGDWTPAQVLIDGAGVGLVDVDTVCLAEPALDVGRFLAYLHVAGIRRGGPAAWPLLDALTARFLSAYHAADQSMAGTPAAAPPDRQRFLHRVEAYRAVTLGRMAANACRQLKEDRLRAVVDVLDSPADAATST